MLARMEVRVECPADDGTALLGIVDRLTSIEYRLVMKHPYPGFETSRHPVGFSAMLVLSYGGAPTRRLFELCEQDLKTIYEKGKAFYQNAELVIEQYRIIKEKNRRLQESYARLSHGATHQKHRDLRTAFKAGRISQPEWQASMKSFRRFRGHRACQLRAWMQNIELALSPLTAADVEQFVRIEPPRNPP